MGNLGGPSWVLEVIDPAAELRNAGGLEGEDINKEEEEREGGGRDPQTVHGLDKVQSSLGRASGQHCPTDAQALCPYHW